MAEFVPFLHGLRAKLGQPPTLGADPGFAPLATSPETPAAPHPTVPPQACGEVKVELKRVGDQVQEIRIQCKCGEIIELLCDY